MSPSPTRADSPVLPHIGDALAGLGADGAGDLSGEPDVGGAEHDESAEVARRHGHCVPVRAVVAEDLLVQRVVRIGPEHPHVARRGGHHLRRVIAVAAGDRHHAPGGAGPVQHVRAVDNIDLAPRPCINWPEHHGAFRGKITIRPVKFRFYRTVARGSGAFTAPGPRSASLVLTEPGRK